MPPNRKAAAKAPPAKKAPPKKSLPAKKKTPSSKKTTVKAKPATPPPAVMDSDSELSDLPTTPLNPFSSPEPSEFRVPLPRSNVEPRSYRGGLHHLGHWQRGGFEEYPVAETAGTLMEPIGEFQQRPRFHLPPKKNVSTVANAAEDDEHEEYGPSLPFKPTQYQRGELQRGWDFTSTLIEPEKAKLLMPDWPTELEYGFESFENSVIMKMIERGENTLVSLPPISRAGFQHLSIRPPVRY